MPNTSKTSGGVAALLAALTIQFTLGIAYLWSLFQSGIAERIYAEYAKPNAAAGLNFSLLIAMMTVGSVIGGKLAAKYSTKKVVFAGGLILGAGFFLSGLVTAQVSWLLWLTYGIMGGLGMGFTYSTTIACAQKWFPHKRGFVTGIVVSGLGFGGVIFTPVIKALIERFGGASVGESSTFMVLGGIFAAVCIAGSLFLKEAPAPAPTSAVSAGAPSSDFTTSQMLKSPAFYLIAFAFLLACLGGLIVINYTKQIAEMKGLAETAVVGVMIISIFNSVGRLVWGMVSDKLGRINTILVLLVGSATLTLFVPSINNWLVYAVIAGIGFMYGGLLSTFPALTSEVFGAKHMATNYGFVLLGFGVGAIIASQVGGYFRDAAVNADGDMGKMFPAFIIGSCCAVGAIVLIVVLRIMTKKKA
ncbi:MAG: OFA family MFS transporter [Oscillospiraceae bacterium]|nr:OFA family MFS transporter [Oscillospiraceae bacterium]